MMTAKSPFSLVGLCLLSALFLGVLGTPALVGAKNIRSLPGPETNSVLQTDLPALTLNVRDFGAVGNGVTDDGPAIQRALNTLAQAGGGTLYVPPGNYAIVTPITKDFTGLASSIVIQGESSTTEIVVWGNGLGLDLTSQLIIKVGAASDALTLRGLQTLLIKDLGFLGVQEVNTDARRILLLDDIQNATILHSEFYGLASLVAGGAIVLAHQSGLTVDQTAFLGCATSSGQTASMIENFAWEKLTVTNTKFIDYGNRPDFFSKTPLASPYSWIGIGNPAPLQPNSTRREAVIKNVFLDEGGLMGVAARPDRFPPPVNPFSVYISGLRMNVTNLGASGVYFDRAQRVFIEQSFFGWSHNTGGAVTIYNVNESILDLIECVAAAHTINANNGTGRLVVINSIYQHLNSAAAYTRAFTTSDPLDDAVQYVRQKYLDILDEGPPLPALYFWADRFLRCEGDTTCLAAKQADLQDFLNSSPATDFMLSGKVEDQDGVPLSGVPVLLSGSTTVTTTTDSQGNYSFGPLATSGEYTLTPTKTHYTFAGQTVTTPSSDRVVDLPGTLNRHTISGRLMNQHGSPIAQASISLSGDQTGGTTSDANGYYSFPAVPAGRNYTVAVARAHHEFSPASRSITDLSANHSLDFPGNLLNYEISGYARTEGGTPISGATITLTGTQTGTTTTDSTGKYNLIARGEGNYVVSISKPNHVFITGSFSISSLTGNVEINFVVNRCAIRGRVRNQFGVGIPGAQLNLSGTETRTTTTNDNGEYEFTALHSDENFTVTVSSPNHTFATAAHSFSNLASDQTADFTGTAVVHTIGGKVAMSNGVGLAGVTINLSGGLTQTALTDNSGNYSFTVYDGANYTVAPVMPHYVSDPVLRQFNNMASPQVANFTLGPRDVVQFSSFGYTVSEGAGAVEITVVRSGDITSAGSVKYRLSDGTASQTHDYTLSAGRLHFAANETTKTFVVLITDDDQVEQPTETVNLALSEPDGFVLAQLNSATLTIVDNNTIPPTSNPIEDAGIFVDQHYDDFLGRAPDPSGLDYWMNRINSCGSDPVCIQARRVEVSAAFFVESEFQQSGGFVYRLIKSITGNRPDYSDFMEHRGFLISFGDMESGKLGFAEDFVTRPEFTTVFPTTLTKIQFVDALIARVRQSTGVNLESERDSLLLDYNEHDSRGRVVKLVADNAEVQQAEFNRAFVLMQYFGYLRRNPDQGGYEFWINVMSNQQPGNHRGMVCAFLTSREFQERFSPVVPRSNQDCATVP